MQKYAATPYAAHHQFYLRDPELAWDGGYTNHPWSDDGLGVAPGVVGVQTPRAAGSTAVFVELHERAPGDPPPRYQKIAAASIATGGKLVLAGEANELDTPSLSISLPTGTYGVRVCYADLDTVTYYSDDGAEHYVVQIYPRSAEPPVVQRAYESGGRPPDRKDRSAEPVEALIAAAGGDDASVACSALVALARKGETTTVASIAASERSTDAVRIVAVYALRLVRAREAIASLSVGGSAVVAHVVARALQGLEEDATGDDAADDDAADDDAADDDAADDDAADDDASAPPDRPERHATRLLDEYVRDAFRGAARPLFGPEHEAAWACPGVSPIALLAVVTAHDARAGVRASIACARTALAGAPDDDAAALISLCEAWIEGGDGDALDTRAVEMQRSLGELDDPGTQRARQLATTVASAIDLVPFLHGRPHSWMADYPRAVVTDCVALFPDRRTGCSRIEAVLRERFPAPPLRG